MALCKPMRFRPAGIVTGTGPLRRRVGFRGAMDITLMHGFPAFRE